MLYQCKCRLHKVSTETLRGIAHELLANMRIETRRSGFHNDSLKHSSNKRCALMSTVLMRRNKAIAKSYNQANKSKKQKDEFEDMVEVERSKKQ